jgi:hypothetical protein
VYAWTVGRPNDTGPYAEWLPFLFSWYRRFRVVPYIAGPLLVALVLDPPRTDEECLDAYLERLSVSLECGFEKVRYEDGLDWRSVDEFVERAMGIRGRGIWSFW